MMKSDEIMGLQGGYSAEPDLVGRGGGGVSLSILSRDGCSPWALGLEGHPRFSLNDKFLVV